WETPQGSCRRNVWHTPASPDHACSAKTRHKTRQDIQLRRPVLPSPLFAPAVPGCAISRESPSADLRTKGAGEDASRLFVLSKPTTSPGGLHVSVRYAVRRELSPVQSHQLLTIDTLR